MAKEKKARAFSLIKLAEITRGVQRGVNEKKIMGKKETENWCGMRKVFLYFRGMEFDKLTIFLYWGLQEKRNRCFLEILKVLWDF